MSESEAKPPRPYLHLLPHEPSDELDNRIEMVGTGTAFLKLERQLRAAANWDREPVLLTGERGSGKEVAARALHFWSPRRQQRFVPVLIPALSEDLLADELFGHKCHSFTGAVNTRPGKFAAANRGTIFLDEIGSLNLQAQAVLLRILERGEVSAIGEDLPRRINVRIVAATNENLSELIDQKRFRADLYDRLRVFEISVPPLRERREDIPFLASYFLRECGKQFGCALGRASCGQCRMAQKTDCAHAEFFEGLQSYNWPGNVRELKNHITRQRASHPHTILDASHAAALIDMYPSPEITGRQDSDTYWSLDTAMRRHIIKVLDHTGWNLTVTAEKLCVPRTTLRDKIKKLRIRMPRGATKS
jgi:formate hydrogenlyase transcriptional activator